MLINNKKQRNKNDARVPIGLTTANLEYPDILTIDTPEAERIMLILDRFGRQSTTDILEVDSISADISDYFRLRNRRQRS